MASADVYTSHGSGGVGEAYTCDTPVSAFRDACAVCVWLEQAIHSALCILCVAVLIYHQMQLNTHPIVLATAFHTWRA